MKKRVGRCFIMVPGAGLEPARYCYRGILSPFTATLQTAICRKINGLQQDSVDWAGMNWRASGKKMAMGVAHAC